MLKMLIVVFCFLLVCCVICDCWLVVCMCVWMLVLSRVM